MSSEPISASPHRRAAKDFSTIEEATQRTGRGYFIYPNGTIYEGEWVRGEREGLGICYYDSGNIYVGHFRRGNMEGEGTMLFNSGEFFIGEFKNSNIYKGVYSSRGHEVRGVWEGGKRVTSFPEETSVELQSAHAQLFSSIMEQVHDHFRVYAKDPRAFPLLANTAGAGLRPPTDISSSNGGQSVNEQTLPRKKLGWTSNAVSPAMALSTAEVQNGSFDSVRRLDMGSMTVTALDFGSKDLRSVLTPPVTVKTYFLCAAPAQNEHFSIFRFGLRLFVFMFPFLSFPHCPCAPLRITPLEEEREFVVSGATLQRSFDAPKWSLYIIAVAMMCHIPSIVIVACKVKLGKAQDGDLTLPEMVIPCVLWLVVALMCAASYSFVRAPHFLERLDRELIPKLSAHTASVIDARARLCINTWDEEGRGKVMNKHYTYRWVMFAVLFGVMMSISAPATRGGFGHNPFGRGYQLAAALLSFFATFLLSSAVSYHVLLCTDFQREVSAKLRALTEVAYLERRNILYPSINVRHTFDLGDHFNCGNVFRGFPGWYVARSLILYASNSSSHAARSATMSVFTTTMFSAYLVAISDVFYMLAEDDEGTNTYFSTAHAYGLFVMLFWGILLVRYFFACSMSEVELRQHLYIMNLTGMYHMVQLQDTDASETIKQCRTMAESHDVKPQLFGYVLGPLITVIIMYLNLAALAAIVFQLAEVIYYR